MAYIYQPLSKSAIQWSAVEKTSITSEKLELLTHSEKVLRKEGYVLLPLNEQEIWRKMRCQNCGQKLRYYRPPSPGSFSGSEGNSMDEEEEFVGFSDDEFTTQQEYADEVVRAAQSIVRTKHRCFFHDGDQFKGVWQCCDGRSNTKGCCSNIDHVAGNVNDLSIEWSFHMTPTPVIPFTSSSSTPAITANSRGAGRRDRYQTRYKNSYTSFSSPPPNQASDPIRPVVALDCEMGISRLGNTELIRLSLIDFFTQESLIDSLVVPDAEMAHYNTRYSGVTFAAMNRAKRMNTGIRGAEKARKMVFKYVDVNTIVIVHGGSNDFTSLRWIHPPTKIIDTCVLEAYDYTVKQNGWKRSLKEVCKRRCGISVQDAKLDNGKAAGHDSLEDALAAREIVCWWLRLIPDH